MEAATRHMCQSTEQVSSGCDIRPPARYRPAAVVVIYVEEDGVQLTTLGFERLINV